MLKYLFISSAYFQLFGIQVFQAFLDDYLNFTGTGSSFISDFIHLSLFSLFWLVWLVLGQSCSLFPLTIFWLISMHCLFNFYSINFWPSLYCFFIICHIRILLLFDSSKAMRWTFAWDLTDLFNVIMHIYKSPFWDCPGNIPQIWVGYIQIFILLQEF